MTLIWKHQEIVPSPKSPFKEDALGREPYADNLTSLIESTREPLVLSVNAQWGAGKTTFLRMWRAKLDGAGFHTLFFDAWKHDFVEDPLIALIAELESEIKESSALSEVQEQAAPLMKRLRTAGAGMLKRSIPVIIRAGTAGLVEVTEFSPIVDELGKGFSDEVAKVAAERIEHYAAEKSAMERFRQNLEELARTLSTDEHRQQIVVFIDELDRCRPDFAILVLERVKHLFSVPGFVFVLGMDAAQLAASVRAVYGADFAAEGYLRRFIDLEFNLPAPAGRIAVEYLARQINLPEALAERMDAQREQQNIVEILSTLVEHVGMSFRTQQQCFSRLNVALRTAPKHADIYPSFLSCMIVLRVLNSQLYQGYTRGSKGAKDVLAYLASLGPSSPFPEELNDDMEAHLYSFSQQRGEYGDKKAELKRQAEAVATPETTPWIIDSYSHRMKLLEWLGPQKDRAVKAFFQRLELTDKFSV